MKCVAASYRCNCLTLGMQDWCWGEAMASTSTAAAAARASSADLHPGCRGDGAEVASQNHPQMRAIPDYLHLRKGPKRSQATSTGHHYRSLPADTTQANGSCCAGPYMRPAQSAIRTQQARLPQCPLSIHERRFSNAANPYIACTAQQWHCGGSPRRYDARFHLWGMRQAAGME